MESLIITVLYDKYKQLGELFPITQVINLQDLKTINYFKNAECIAIIVDVDHLPTLPLEDIIKQTKRYHSKVIFTSNSHDAVKYLQKYGTAVDKDQELIAKQILQIYTSLVKQNRGSYIFDYEARTVSNAGTIYKVQNTPFLILNHLVKNKNRACSRDELMEAVYRYELDSGITKINTLSDVRSVDVHIHNLRKTIPDKRIKTIINEGYMYEDDSDKIKVKRAKPVKSKVKKSKQPKQQPEVIKDEE